jgi:prophage antirepressor-like protein
MELINQIDETFKFENKEIRVLGSYNEPWFVAKDICDILGLSNITNALKNIPEKWMTLKLLRSSYNSQHMNMISEPAVYKLIMRSNKPVAQKFQEVVCEEILPSLRKKGEYKIQSIIDKNKELEEEKLILQANNLTIYNDKILLEEEKNKLEKQKTKVEEKFKNTDEKYNKILNRHCQLLKKRKRKRNIYEIGNVLYIITHPAFTSHYNTEYYKFGISTQNVDETIPALTQRLSSYNTCAPSNYEICYYIYIEENLLIENMIKLKFKDYLDPSNKEWLKSVKLENIIEFIKNLCELLGLEYKKGKLHNDEDTSIDDSDNEEDTTIVDEDRENDQEDTTMVGEEKNIDNEEDTSMVDTDNEEDTCMVDVEEDVTKELQLNKKSNLKELQIMCIKNGLSEKGSVNELFERIDTFNKTGKVKNYQTLKNLIELCKQCKLIYTGNKSQLSDRIIKYLETGENIRYVNEEKSEEIKKNEPVINELEKKELLENLNIYRTIDLVKICNRFKITHTDEKIETIKERIKKYLESGEQYNNHHQNIYAFDINGKIIKYYNSIAEAAKVHNICENILKLSIDKKQSLNKIIFRTSNVSFTEKELDEINENNKIFKRNLKVDDYIIIKNMHTNGANIQELMDKFSKSKTQIRRILKKELT